jgi:hypothetical protein
VSFSKVSQCSPPYAWSTSLNDDRVSEHSTGPLPAKERTNPQSFPLNPGGFGPLQSAASVWWQRTIYSQMACAEQVSAGTQPCVPVVTGQPGIPDSACFVPQSGCSGLEAVSGQSALLTLSVTCEECKVDGELASISSDARISCIIILGSFVQCVCNSEARVCVLSNDF